MGPRLGGDPGRRVRGARWPSSPRPGRRCRRCAVGMTKQLFEHAHTASLEEQLALEAELQQAAVGTADFAEGVERLPGEAATELHRRLSGAGPLARRSTDVRAASRPPSPTLRRRTRSTSSSPTTSDRSRLTVFFRLLLVIPHLIWLSLWGIAVWFAVLVAWVVGIFTGRVPGRPARLHRVVPALPDPRLRVLLRSPPTRTRRSRATPGYPVDVEIAPRDEAEPAHDLLPAACS